MAQGYKECSAQKPERVTSHRDFCHPNQKWLDAASAFKLPFSSQTCSSHQALYHPSAAPISITFTANQLNISITVFFCRWPTIRFQMKAVPHLRVLLIQRSRRRQSIEHLHLGLLSLPRPAVHTKSPLSPISSIHHIIPATHCSFSPVQMGCTNIQMEAMQ